MLMHGYTFHDIHCSCADDLMFKLTLIIRRKGLGLKWIGLLSRKQSSIDNNSDRLFYFCGPHKCDECS